MAVGPDLSAFKAFKLDWSARVSGFEHLARTLQAAGVVAAADVAVPDDESVELPEWLADFAARVRALPRKERRALLSNLLGIALAIASTTVVWSTTAGAAGYVTSGWLMKAVLDFRCAILALYEEDDSEECPRVVAR